jgi:hypothetical protein
VYGADAAERERVRAAGLAAQNERWAAKNLVAKKLNALGTAASELSCDGEYGILVWHEERGHVWWVAGDADGLDTGTSAQWQIEQAFAGLDFVNAATVANAATPPDAGDGFDPRTGIMENGWRLVAHAATVIDEPPVRSDKEHKAAAAADARGLKQWQAGAGNSRVDTTSDSAWVRPGHEDAYREYVATMALTAQNA